MGRNKIRGVQVLRELGVTSLTDVAYTATNELQNETERLDGATYVKTTYVPVTVYEGELVPQGITLRGLPVEEQVVAVLADELVPHSINLRLSGALVPSRCEAK